MPRRLPALCLHLLVLLRFTRFLRWGPPGCPGSPGRRTNGCRDRFLEDLFDPGVHTLPGLRRPRVDRSMLVRRQPKRNVAGERLLGLLAEVFAELQIHIDRLLKLLDEKRHTLGLVG